MLARFEACLPISFIPSTAMAYSAVALNPVLSLTSSRHWVLVYSAGMDLSCQLILVQCIGQGKTGLRLEHVFFEIL